MGKRIIAALRKIYKTDLLQARVATLEETNTFMTKRRRGEGEEDATSHDGMVGLPEGARGSGVGSRDPRSSSRGEGCYSHDGMVGLPEGARGSGVGSRDPRSSSRGVGFVESCTHR